MRDLELFLVQLIWLSMLRELRGTSRRGLKGPREVWGHFWALHIELGCPPLPYNAGAFI